MVLNSKAKQVLAFCICMLLVFAGPSSANLEKPNVIKDLHYGEVLFHFYQDDYFTSIVHLLAARDLNRTTNHIPEDELLLGGIDLSFGLHNEASRIFEKLLQENVSETVRNRAYYYLAKIYYQRGYLDEAAEYLSRISGAVQGSIFGELKLLMGQVYLAQGKYTDAISSLDNWKGPKNYRNYAKYNLGVAYTKNGNIGKGVEYLRDVGKIRGKSESSRTLKDKANLAAGLTLIQNEQPEKAAKYLNNVRLEGLYSNMALLGIGWANTEADNHEAALVPLMELRNRSAYHSEVQEGILALAYAYNQLGLTGHAVQAYEQAAEIYHNEAVELANSARAIEQGVLVDALLGRTKGGPQMGWFWTLRELPEIPEVKYFTKLIAEHEFHEALKNFRDLLFLQRNLKHWDENISIYLTMLDTRKARYQKYLPLVEKRLSELDLNQLQMHRDNLSNILSDINNQEAYLNLATVGEKQKLSKIENLSKRLDELEAKNPNDTKIKQIREKVALMLGVLHWQIHSEFINRKWEHRQDISEIDKSLKVTPGNSVSVKKAIDESVKKFDEFESRILALQKETKRLMPIVDRVIVAQSRYLEYVAVKELKRREKILAGYEKHARFALAAAYDRVTSQPKNMDEQEEL
ncbi:MAG: tetratricopeptide repeat protein [Gammaproteobacteria bacterium]